MLNSKIYIFHIIVIILFRMIFLLDAYFQSIPMVSFWSVQGRGHSKRPIIGNVPETPHDNKTQTKK